MDWDLENGLNSEISLYLSEGRSREVEIEVSILDQTIESNLQSFQITMDPGRSGQLNLDFGNPTADSLIFRARPISWIADEEIEIKTNLISPNLELVVSSRE